VKLWVWVRYAPWIMSVNEWMNERRYHFPHENLPVRKLVGLLTCCSSRHPWSDKAACAFQIRSPFRLRCMVKNRPILNEFASDVEWRNPVDACCPFFSSLRFATSKLGIHARYAVCELVTIIGSKKERRSQIACYLA